MKNLHKALAWVATGAAVAVSVYITKSGWWLWFMLLPLLVS